MNQKAVRVLLLDNIDSFTYNIFHYLEGLDVVVDVIDNCSIDLNLIGEYQALIISPGPGLPSEAGKLMEVLEKAVELKLPVLGICLGMQAIAEYFGGMIFNQQEVKHGQAAQINVTQSSSLFHQLSTSFQVGLYHSWAVSNELPTGLISTSFSEEGIMMSLEHQHLPIYGVQFHPESILSEHGMTLLANFLAVAKYPEKGIE